METSPGLHFTIPGDVFISNKGDAVSYGSATVAGAPFTVMFALP